MSLFSWFSRKPPLSKPALSSGLLRNDETRPQGRGQTIPSIPVAASGNDPKKNARYMRRELLYAIVRESMVRFGILSAGYKFKALALDPRGLKFMVMIDLAIEFGGQSERLSEIERLIAQTAKVRHGIAVGAVYWRLNEHVTVGPVSPGAASQMMGEVLGPTRSDNQGARTSNGSEVSQPNTFSSHQLESHSASQPMPLFPLDGLAAQEASEHTNLLDISDRFEPIAQDEVAAFRRALTASASPVQGVAKLNASVQSLERPSDPSYAFLTGFEDTEAVDPDFAPPALGTTQYGELR